MSAPGAAEAPPPGIRVVSVPGSDAYVDAVLPPQARRVPRPGRWLDLGHLTEHAGEVDVVHVHAGLAPLAADGLECWAETLRRLDIPLVATVHQLCAPGQGPLDAVLAPLLATAEVVFTLTPGAAAEIAERFGRTAIVVAHPSLAVPVPELGAERGLVGLVLGPGAPAGLDRAALVRAAQSGALSGGGRLRVLAEAGPGAEQLRPLAAEHDIELVTHPGVCGGSRVAPGWTAQLQQLHVAVLPERRRTHSRDLEICRDVGTRVVTPSCGWFAEQWREVVSYGDDDAGGFDPVSVTAAVAAALTRPAPRPADQTWRAEQRAAVRRVHGQVYAQISADRCRF